MPSKKRGSDNSSRGSRPSSSKSKLEDHSEENSRDASTALVDEFGNPPPAYPVNLRMLCRHTDSFYYEAKILKVDHTIEGVPLYTIHYNVSCRGNRLEYIVLFLRDGILDLMKS